MNWILLNLWKFLIYISRQLTIRCKRLFSAVKYPQWEMCKMFTRWNQHFHIDYRIWFRISLTLISKNFSFFIDCCLPTAKIFVLEQIDWRYIYICCNIKTAIIKNWMCLLSPYFFLLSHSEVWNMYICSFFQLSSHIRCATWSYCDILVIYKISLSSFIIN